MTLDASAAVRGVEGRSGVATLELGALSLVGVPGVWGNPFGLAPLVGGVLGVHLICQLPSTRDWQRSRFFLGAPPTDVDVTGEVIRRPFRLIQRPTRHDHRRHRP